MFTIMLLGFGCAGQPSNEAGGTCAGGATGGVIGSEGGDGTTGAVIGGAVGALIGREVGRRMDVSDRENARTAFEENRTARTLPANATRTPTQGLPLNFSYAKLTPSKALPGHPPKGCHLISAMPS